MAANPKTQLLKLGIGTATVVATVGVTGWLWQAQQASASGLEGAQASQAAPATPQMQPQIQQQQRGGETHVEPRTRQGVSPSFGTVPGQGLQQQQQQQRRTRSKHS